MSKEVVLLVSEEREHEWLGETSSLARAGAALVVEAPGANGAGGGSPPVPPETVAVTVPGPDAGSWLQEAARSPRTRRFER